MMCVCVCVRAYVRVRACVCVIFIVSSFIHYAFMGYMSYTSRFIIYAIIKFWGALCLILAFCLSICKVGALWRLKQFSYMQAWCLGIMNSSIYVCFLLELASGTFYEFCVIPLLDYRVGAT